jgi:hypothetical protein
MENYHKVKLRFEENGCILLTTFEEFEELREKVLISHINLFEFDSLEHALMNRM